MSHQTVSQATLDTVLQERVKSAAQKEAQNSATLNATEIAKQLKEDPNLAIKWFMWPVAIDYESEYEYAINSENPDPGGDEGVITDGNITAAVVTHWPPDPTP